MKDGTLYDASSRLEGENRVVNSTIFDMAGSGSVCNKIFVASF